MTVEVVDPLGRPFDPRARLLDERPVPVAPEQLVAADVRQRHVEVAVAIDVADPDPHRVHVEPGTRLDRHVGERPAVGAGAIVVPQPVLIGREADEVVADVQVGTPVVVDVEPGGGEAGRRPRALRQQVGDVLERPVTVGCGTARRRRRRRWRSPPPRSSRAHCTTCSWSRRGRADRHRRSRPTLRSSHARRRHRRRRRR